jgi:hypothetical protein
LGVEWGGNRGLMGTFLEEEMPSNFGEKIPKFSGVKTLENLKLNT